ncbi:MAG: serine/threonine protein kinase [Verrucomicrobiaceae bacterium]|nr:serine/threonine protein kinase [Verrucomicrobiaceae bacterium]
MPAKPPSLIIGLDPAALFGLSAAETPAGIEWEPPPVEEASKLFPQWKVIRLLGRGGMGAVYEMHQPELDRTVAVKLLPIEASSDEHLVERFRREARTLAKLRHPGIVALLESGITPAGHLFFVMEHVSGSPLSQWIAEGRLDVPKAIEIVRQVCEALAYAHAQGVIHRDIKPSNILIDQNDRAKVADFGLARLDQAETTSGAISMSRTGQFMGTPAYAAPEQVKDAAHVDHRADIYALGVLLYEMLTGDLPRGVFQPPSAKARTGPHLDDVVRRAMQERPEDRYQAAAELQKDISRNEKRRKVWLLLLIIAITAAAVIWALQNRIDKTDPSDQTEIKAVAQAPPAIIPEPEKLEAPPPTPPAPPPLPAPTIHVWSIDPVSPALQPPTTLTQQPWKDAVLTATGGAVLLTDGRVLTWDEKTPNEAPKQVGTAVSLASAENELFTLDTENRLHRRGDKKTLTEGLKAVFSSARPGTLLALNHSGEPVTIETATGATHPLPKPSDGPIQRLAMSSKGEVWCLLQSGALLQLANNTFTPAPPPNQLSDFQLGNGAMLLIEPNGRCTLSGEKIPDSPQRFRLPAGAKNIRLGPQTRLAAW